VPIDTLLRLLYLKHRYQLGYESLCREVSDSIGWPFLEPRQRAEQALVAVVQEAYVNGRRGEILA
jgi:hypothetical protein